MFTVVLQLIPYLQRYRKQFVVGFVFLFLATSIQLISPWILKYAIDDLTVGVTRIKLGFYASLLIVVALAFGFFRFLMRRVIIGASRQIEYDLRNDFFFHLQRMPLSYFQKHRTGDLMSRATNDLSAVRMMVGPAVMYSATTLIVFVVAVILMVSISPWLTFFVLLPLPFVSLAVKKFGSAIYQRSEQIQEQLANLSSITQEALAGVRVVRAYGREPVEVDRFRVANKEYMARSRAVIQLQGLFYPSMAVFLGFSALILLGLGSRQVVLGQITVGDFVAFNAYLVMLTWPMIAFGWVTNMLQRGTAAWKRMLKVLETESVLQISKLSSKLTVSADIQGRVEFRNLSFTYDRRPVLQHVSAFVEPGQVLGLVGPTGSGKSTLVDLIPRIFDPPTGTVFIDGVDIRSIPLQVLRGAISYVSQEPFLFSETIDKNVTFGVLGDSSNATAFETAVTTARLDKDIKDFPKGFQTMIGERGITLSGGQKQRVAIARALMMNPRILILDDALSAVDTRTENEILLKLRTVMRQRTSIVVSHRISTLRNADLILVLDHGKIVERGTHEELLFKNGFYAGLHRKQLLEEELKES